LHEQIINPPKRRKRKRRDEGNNLKVDDNINPNILEKLEKSKEIVVEQPLEDLKAIGIIPKKVHNSRSKKMLVFSTFELKYNIDKFAEIILKLQSLIEGIKYRLSRCQVRRNPSLGRLEIAFQEFGE